MDFENAPHYTITLRIMHAFREKTWNRTYSLIDQTAEKVKRDQHTKSTFPLFYAGSHEG